MSELEQLRKQIAEVDAVMAALFEKRMSLCEGIARCKSEAGLPVFDPEQEKRVLERNLALIQDSAKKEIYKDFLQNLMDLSKQYQKQL